MNKLLFLGLMIFALLFGIARFRKERAAENVPHPAFATAAAAKDSCEGKKVCAVAYLAPWCPHCKRMIPDLKEMLLKAQASSDKGLRVIAGAGEPEANQALAAEFGTSGVVDANREIQQKLGVRQFPSFYLLNEKGHLMAGDQAAYQWLYENLR